MKSPPRSKASAGLFTPLELAVVLLILGLERLELFAGVAIPHLRVGDVKAGVRDDKETASRLERVVGVENEGRHPDAVIGRDDPLALLAEEVLTLPPDPAFEPEHHLLPHPMELGAADPSRRNPADGVLPEPGELPR
ncbi:MAG: hypothetical protein UW89_C0003G0007 [Parcubacteria group bacterium GW2011_GWB1_45_10]|nr:MAG: hypothetical protein UW89_C0003G0007 [Parcubacteria group bacterium GW2011_GWB1_45_10]